MGWCKSGSLPERGILWLMPTLGQNSLSDSSWLQITSLTPVLAGLGVSWSLLGVLWLKLWVGVEDLPTCVYRSWVHQGTESRWATCFLPNHIAHHSLGVCGRVGHWGSFRFRLRYHTCPVSPQPVWLGVRSKCRPHSLCFISCSSGKGWGWVRCCKALTFTTFLGLWLHPAVCAPLAFPRWIQAPDLGSGSSRDHLSGSNVWSGVHTHASRQEELTLRNLVSLGAPADFTAASVFCSSCSWFLRVSKVQFLICPLALQRSRCFWDLCF